MQVRIERGCEDVSEDVDVCEDVRDNRQACDGDGGCGLASVSLSQLSPFMCSSFLFSSATGWRFLRLRGLLRGLLRAPSFHHPITTKIKATEKKYCPRLATGPYYGGFTVLHLPAPSMPTWPRLCTRTNRVKLGLPMLIKGDFIFPYFPVLYPPFVALRRTEHSSLPFDFFLFLLWSAFFSPSLPSWLSRLICPLSFYFGEPVWYGSTPSSSFHPLALLVDISRALAAASPLQNAEPLPVLCRQAVFFETLRSNKYFVPHNVCRTRIVFCSYTAHRCSTCMCFHDPVPLLCLSCLNRCARRANPPPTAPN